MRILAVTLAVAVLAVGGWISTYPSSSDPKNLTYVLWRAGIYRLDPDIATGTTISDGGRDRLVVGKTKQQLRDRFGYLVKPSDASPYLRNCYENSSWKNGDALFIRKSPWMVVFSGDIATNLILMKGC
jgi:hypothetical protein